MIMRLYVFERMPCYNNTHDNFLTVLKKMDLQSRNVWR